jgi:TPP-dependent pyruvate/acetoin dehydrogenase alpha subunit
MISPIDRKNIDKKIKDEFASALKFAEQSPFPSELELYKNVYK